jgi:hypothetical protein
MDRKQCFSKSSVGVSWVGGEDHDLSGLAEGIRPLICIIFLTGIIKGIVWAQLSSLPIEKKYARLILIVYASSRLFELVSDSTC